MGRGGCREDAQLQELEVLVRRVLVREVEFEEYTGPVLGVDRDGRVGDLQAVRLDGCEECDVPVLLVDVGKLVVGVGGVL